MVERPMMWTALCATTPVRAPALRHHIGADAEALPNANFGAGRDGITDPVRRPAWHYLEVNYEGEYKTRA